MVRSAALVVALAGVAAAAPAPAVKRDGSCTIPANATQVGVASLCSFVCNSGFSYVGGACQASNRRTQSVPSASKATTSAASSSAAATSSSAQAASQTGAAASTIPDSSSSSSSTSGSSGAVSGSSSSSPSTGSSSSSGSSVVSNPKAASGSGSSPSSSSVTNSGSSSSSSSSSSDIPSIGSALGGSVVGSDGQPGVVSGGSSSGSSAASNAPAMALSGQVSGFPFIGALNGTVAELVKSGIRGFLGNNTNAIASWFRSSNPADSTNGHSWCWTTYNDTTPGFAVSLSTMLTNFYNDTMAARRAYCGLEAIVYSPRTNKNVTLYMVDAFDDHWVKTPTSMDVMIGSFPLLWDNTNSPNGTAISLIKNDVVFPVSWSWTGNRHPDYVFNGPGVGPRPYGA